MVVFAYGARPGTKVFICPKCAKAAAQDPAGTIARKLHGFGAPPGKFRRGGPTGQRLLISSD